MLKYKRYNASELAKQFNSPYSLFDILRQTAIENIVKHNEKIDKQTLIDNVLKICKFLLERSIEEK